MIPRRGFIGSGPMGAYGLKSVARVAETRTARELNPARFGTQPHAEYSSNAEERRQARVTVLLC